VQQISKLVKLRLELRPHPQTSHRQKGKVDDLDKWTRKRGANGSYASARRIRMCDDPHNMHVYSVAQDVTCEHESYAR
jgi:hypothetical protein